MSTIDQKYTELARQGISLGEPLTPETSTPDGIGSFRQYRGGFIYWHPNTGAYELHGDILALYQRLGGSASFLGFPQTDELAGARPGSRVSRFEGGAIFWSPTTGAHEIHGQIYIRYLYLEAERGFLGLPISDEESVPGGRKSEFQGGTLYWSGDSGAHEIHGMIRERYRQLGGPASFLGFPTSDESDVLTRDKRPSGGKVSRFQHGTIYWTGRTGAFEVHGAIRELYETQLGGPLGVLGYPITNETNLPDSDIRYNNFERGVIVWRPSTGARAVTELDLYLSWVKAGKVDDGITWFSADRSAELVTYTTVVVDGRVLESNKRRPGDHAGDSYDLNASYRLSPIRANTTVSFKIKVDDWDAASSNDYLATLEKTFDIRSFWGMDNGANGVYIGHPATHKGGDAPRYDTIKFDFRISLPSRLAPDGPFRQQAWWQFDNFKTPKLSRQLYANTFRDVEVTGSTWEEILNPFDSLYYELAYDKITAGGNCFGMSVEALYALMGRSVFAEPIFQYGDNPVLREVINMKHGYQLGAEHIRWALSRLTSLDAVRPLNIFARVAAQLARGDRPVISMFSVKDFRGHSVLAYGFEAGRDGAPHRIFVADPNKPWLEAATSNPCVIEIFPNNTFKFMSNGSVRYQSSTLIDGLLPGTVIYDTPFHIISSQPRTPFWEIIQGLLSVLGGLIFLGGDAEIEDLKADSGSFYTTTDAGRGIVPNAIPGLARIPILDYEGRIPELYAQRGRLPNKLELSVSSLKDITTSTSQNGGFHLGMRLPQNAITLDSPIAPNSHDRIEVTETRSTHPLLTVNTEEATKAAKVKYAVFLDKQGRNGWSLEMDWSLAQGVTARLNAAPDGLNFVVENAGPARPIDLRLVTIENSRPTRSMLTLPVEATQGIIRLKPEDLVSPHGNLVIERLGSFNGSVLERLIERMHPDLR
jgi:hypothetical protein